MNSLLNCVLDRQGHSDRVALNISNTVLFWIVTKFTVCFDYSTKILSFYDLCWTSVPNTSQRSVSALQALFSFAESLMLTLHPEKSLFLYPTMLYCFLRGQSLTLLQSSFQTRAKEARKLLLYSFLPKAPNLACINTWLPWRMTEVFTVTSCHQGGGLISSSHQV